MFIYLKLYYLWLRQKVRNFSRYGGARESFDVLSVLRLLSRDRDEDPTFLPMDPDPAQLKKKKIRIRI